MEITRYLNITVNKRQGGSEEKGEMKKIRNRTNKRGLDVSIADGS